MEKEKAIVYIKDTSIPYLTLEFQKKTLYEYCEMKQINKDIIDNNTNLKKIDLSKYKYLIVYSFISFL
jgi:hypothetical protein